MTSKTGDVLGYDKYTTHSSSQLEAGWTKHGKHEWKRRRSLLRNFLWRKWTENLMITKFPNTIWTGKIMTVLFFSYSFLPITYESHTQFYISSRTKQQSETHHLKHRLIRLRGDFWKNQFRTSRMTTSVSKTSLTIGMDIWQGTFMWSERWKTTWFSQEKHYGQDTGKRIGHRNDSIIPNFRLVMTKKSSPMKKTHTWNTSTLRCVGGWKETGWRGGGCHVVWLSGFSLVCLVCE